MRSLKLGSFLLTIILVASAVLAQAGQPARTQTGPTNVVSRGVLPPTLIFNRSLKSTSQSWDCCSPVAIGPGFVALDGVLTFTCPGPTTCTVSAEQNAQLRGTTSANRWAICTELDGLFMAEPSCPFLGTVPSDDSYVAGAFTQ